MNFLLALYLAATVVGLSVSERNLLCNPNEWSIFEQDGGVFTFDNSSYNNCTLTITNASDSLALPRMWLGNANGTVYNSKYSFEAFVLTVEFTYIQGAASQGYAELGLMYRLSQWSDALKNWKEASSYGFFMQTAYDGKVWNRCFDESFLGGYNDVGAIVFTSKNITTNVKYTIQISVDYNDYNMINITLDDEILYQDFNWATYGLSQGSIGFWTYYTDIILHSVTIEEINPTMQPTTLPTNYPTNEPSTKSPSYLPSMNPSDIPSNVPSGVPSNFPTSIPSLDPSVFPSRVPTTEPSIYPTNVPTTNISSSSSSTSEEGGSEESSSNNQSNNIFDNEAIVIALIVCSFLAIIIIVCMILIYVYLKQMHKREEKMARIASMEKEKSQQNKNKYLLNKQSTIELLDTRDSMLGVDLQSSNKKNNGKVLKLHLSNNIASSSVNDSAVGEENHDVQNEDFMAAVNSAVNEAQPQVNPDINMIQTPGKDLEMNDTDNDNDNNNNNNDKDEDNDDMYSNPKQDLTDVFADLENGLKNNNHGSDGMDLNDEHHQEGFDANSAVTGGDNNDDDIMNESEMGGITTDGAPSEEMTQKDILLLIKDNLIKNGVNPAKILSFLKEFAKYNVTGRDLIQFQNNNQLLDAFQMKFSRKNQILSIWLTVNTIINDFGKLEK